MKIVHKQILASNSGIQIIKIEVTAPEIAKRALPGQFILLMIQENGERTPLTVVDTDKVKGTITLIFQELGLTTKLLGKMNVGDSLYALVGPLGHATEIKKYGKVIVVGGGVGAAEIFPVVRSLKEAGNHVITILGSRSKDLLILEKELQSVSSEFFVTTDDGSYGRKGFTTDVLNELLTQGHCDWVYAVGPIPMMRRVSDVTRKFNVRTTVSLNTLMVDGTGMCGGCRVEVAGKTQFSCVDGPEFDGHQIDWDGLIKRNKIYEDKEKHICRIHNLI